MSFVTAKRNAMPSEMPSEMHEENTAQQCSNSSSIVIGLATGILGVVSLYVENQSKGLFHAYQACIAFCIIDALLFCIIVLIPVR